MLFACAVVFWLQTDAVYGGEKEETEEKGETPETVKDELPKVSADDWELVLVNKQNYIREGMEPELGSLSDGHKVDKRIVRAYERMSEAAKKDGVILVICSAYRDYDYQTGLFDKKIKGYMSEGLPYLDAYRNSAFSVTVPGTSEHTLGLALDIVAEDYSRLDEGFEETDQGKWLKEHAPEYGFILRYPKDKEYITGITYEPWHFRYVGVESAEYITENGLVLEEYVRLLKEREE
ncbi:MAG: M15 family metallopeptidase [Lachnospiraceae bacterium]|nr:M15 family metallopeptidase [Lachnospiraceae bacterium]